MAGNIFYIFFFSILRAGSPETKREYVLHDSKKKTELLFVALFFSIAQRAAHCDVLNIYILTNI